MTHSRRLRAALPRHGGFTIVEVMTVVAILGVVMALALPAMRQMVTTQRVKSAAYDLNADMTYARSEAIARGVDVIVASTSGSTDWRQGWTIRETAGSTTLRETSAYGEGLTMTGSGATVTFERTGRATAGATVTFSLFPSDGSGQDFQKRCLRLDPSGRVRTAMGACS